MKTPPSLILNAMLTAGQPSDLGVYDNCVYLAMSGAHSSDTVAYGSVTVNVNGRDVETLAGNGIAWRQGIPLTEELRPGDVVTLTARARGIARNINPQYPSLPVPLADYAARARVVLPQPVADLRADTALATDSRRRYDIRFTDLAGTDGGYRLDMEHVSVLSGNARIYGYTYHPEDDSYHYWEYRTDTSLTERPLLTFDNSDDVILNEGRPSSEERDQEMFITYFDNLYSVFNDALFRDAEAHLHVYTPLDPYRGSISLGWSRSGYIGEYTGSWTNSVQYVIEKMREVRITSRVRLYTLDDATYRYYRAMNVRMGGDYDEELMEPVVMPQNVEGTDGTRAIGFVGATAVRTVAFDLGSLDVDDLLYY